MSLRSTSPPFRVKAAPMVPSRSGWGYGIDFSNTASTSEKTAVLAPIARPRVTTAVMVKPGALISWRQPNLRSSAIMLSPQIACPQITQIPQIQNRNVPTHRGPSGRYDERHELKTREEL